MTNSPDDMLLAASRGRFELADNEDTRVMAERMPAAPISPEAPAA